MMFQEQQDFRTRIISGIAMRIFLIILAMAIITTPFWGSEALALAGRLADTVHGSYVVALLSNSFIGCF